jgi:hypothetical protein
VRGPGDDLDEAERAALKNLLAGLGAPPDYRS